MRRSTLTLRFVLPFALLLALLTCVVTLDSIAHAAVPNETQLATCDPVGTANVQILALYVLAFDNDPSPTNTFNLSPKAADTITNLAAATASNSAVQAVVLVDQDGPNDTRMLTVANGVVNTVSCLPNGSGVLDASLTELDTTDGDTLGGFIMWARATFDASRTTFSYIGHGTFFAPETGLSLDSLSPSRSASARAPIRGGLSPLPSKLEVNPFFTDANVPGGSAEFVTPHDLATALAKGTNQGSSPIDVLDLVHCFAGSVEQLYEVSPYADYTIASPNYTYYDPSMPADALAAFSATHSANALAQTILSTYESIIAAATPLNAHPYVMLAIDNMKLDNLKQKWDLASKALLAEFDTSPTFAAAAIDNAYVNSSKYDTTYCDDPLDLALAPPDALSDMRSFANELAQQGLDTDTNSALGAAVLAMNDLLPFSQATGNGNPWFYTGSGSTPFWQFSEEPMVSLFTPFDVWTSEAGDNYHVWQSLWYTDSVSYQIDETEILNEQPFAFVKHHEDAASWADVLARYWAVRNERPGVDVGTALCGAPIVPLAPNAIRMRITATADRSAVDTGDLIGYQVVITNSGPHTATQVAAVMQLSPLTTLASAANNCVFIDGYLVCSLDDIRVAESAELAITVQALSPGTAAFSAEISAYERIGPTSDSATTAISGTPLATHLSANTADAHAAPSTLIVAIIALACITTVTRRQLLRR